MNAYYNEQDIKRKSFDVKKLIKILKFAVIASLLFGFISILGMIDRGVIGYALGILLCTVICFFEVIAIGSVVEDE